MSHINNMKGESPILIFYKWLKSVYRYLYLRLIPRKIVIDTIYKKKFGHSIDWKNPRDLNEKINWLKLNSDTSEWTKLADKYEVRQYVKEKGYEDILVNLYGHWQNVKDINFEILPKSFVLKTNHGSGDVIIVHDKEKINRNLILKKLNKYLKRPFGYNLGEYHYLKIKPCIIAEQFLEQDCASVSTSLIDYKIWCFDGEPQLIFVCFNRTKDYLYIEVYDLDWTYCPQKAHYTDHFRNGGGIIPKPKNLTKMLEIARNLSQGFPQVRVDLYENNNKVYFGEMTFTSNGGYMDYFTEDCLIELGNQITINH